MVEEHNLMVCEVVHSALHHGGLLNLSRECAIVVEAREQPELQNVKRVKVAYVLWCGLHGHLLQCLLNIEAFWTLLAMPTQSSEDRKERERKSLSLLS